MKTTGADVLSSRKKTQKEPGRGGGGGGRVVATSEITEFAVTDLTIKKTLNSDKFPWFIKSEFIIRMKRSKLRYKS